MNRLFSRRQSGSASVELMFVVPIFLLLIFLGMDLARVMNASILLAGAAREGALAAVPRPLAETAFVADGHIQNAAVDYASSNPSLAGFDTGRVTVSRRCRCPADGSQNDPCTEKQFNDMVKDCAQEPELYVGVTATWPFSTVMRLPGVPSSIRLSERALMRVQ